MVSSNREQRLEVDAEAIDREAGELDEATLDAMFARVEATNSRNDRGLTGWLRTRPTALRQLLLVGAGALTAGLWAALGLRSNLRELPSAYLLGSVLGLAAGGVLSAALALRPLHKRALSQPASAALALVGLGAIWMVAWTSPALADAPTPPLLASAAHCGLGGVAVALPVLLLARLLDRGNLSGPLMSALTAGFVANLTLMLRCPVTDPAHCVAGHFGVALLLVALAGALRRLAAR